MEHSQPDFLIRISRNTSLFNIHLGTVPQWCWQFNSVFDIYRGGHSLTLENCVVKYNAAIAAGYGDFISYSEFLKSALILKTKFYGYDSYGFHTGHLGNKRKDLKRRISIDSDASIKFEQCYFNKQTIDIEFPVVSVVRSVFIDSTLLSSNFRDLQINQSQFFRS